MMEKHRENLKDLMPPLDFLENRWRGHTCTLWQSGVHQVFRTARFLCTGQGHLIWTAAVRRHLFLFHALSTGVPQGSFLEFLLFALYKNPT